jgi:flagellar basal body rod protein FlgC
MTRIDNRPPALLPIPGQQVVRPMFKSMGIAASGIAAQRQRMETIAQNIANADVTRGVDGQPYKRRAVLTEAANANNGTAAKAANTRRDLNANCPMTFIRPQQNHANLVANNSQLAKAHFTGISLGWTCVA